MSDGRKNESYQEKENVFDIKTTTKLLFTKKITTFAIVSDCYREKL